MQIWGLLFVSFLSGSALSRALAPEGFQVVPKSDLTSLSERSEAARIDARSPEPADDHRLVARARIDRYTKIAKGQTLTLASGEEITVDSVGLTYSSPVRPYSAEISRDLDSLGEQVANDPNPSGSRTREGARGNFIVRWHTFTGPRVALTTTEAQAIIHAIYRDMADELAGFSDIRFSSSRSTFTFQITVA
ncbi:hypothetical protein GGS26DRAFT_604959 [Hypomontagnella submonticulosa]|nr:hypothetical protein GGS26DRAFT_604959 [Hypomontagnella submonticulosa]